MRTCKDIETIHQEEIKMQPGDKIGAACISHPGDSFAKKQKIGESFQTGLEAR